MDEALSTALKLESLYEFEAKKKTDESKVNMADVVIVDEETAGVNIVGARSDENMPAWARTFVEQQTKLMEKLLEATTTLNTPRKKSVTCFRCGKVGHYRRECQADITDGEFRQSRGGPGNANRAGSRRL